MKTKLFLILAIFFSISIKAQIGFEPHVIIDDEGGTNGANSVFAADLDGDGDMDMISSSGIDNKIAWYENTNGDFGPQQIINETRNRTIQVIAADIDGDGDMDLINSATLGGIVWFENIDGLGNFTEPQNVNLATISATEIVAKDMDNDGDLDVVANGGINSSVAWFENMDGQGNFSTEHTIVQQGIRISTISVGDIDGDGFQDVLTTARDIENVSWYKNINGNFGTHQIITTDVSNPDGNAIADIDGDGDLDVVAVSTFVDRKIIWFPNLDGLGNFGDEQVVNSNNSVGSKIKIADVDNDGALDIIDYGFSIISYYKNFGGFFSNPILVTDNVNFLWDVELADLDNDGDLDIMSASSTDDKIAFYSNINGFGNFGAQQIILEINGVNGPNTVLSIDMDGDGDKDILSAATYGDKIAWQKNLDGQGSFSEPITISLQLDYPVSINAADIDGDGDMDVVSESYQNKVVGWFENMDGQGNTFSAHLFPPLSSQPLVTYPVDIDSDGDIDIISGGDNTVFYFENIDGQGNFSSPQIIYDNFGSIESVSASDIDNDGDLDLVVADYIDDILFWLENNGNGNFGEAQIIATELDSLSIQCVDIDNDGDPDIIAGIFGESSVVWFENINGQGNFSSPIDIDTNGSGAYEVYAKDLDDDGDMDVLSAIYLENSVFWYENDGVGNFGEPQLIANNVDYSSCVFADDYNGDGKMDVLASSIRNDDIIWFENLGPLGIEENTTNFFSIYPNPTNGLLNIKSTMSVSEITIYNNIGQLLFTSQDTNQIDLSTLTNGIYFVKIKDENGLIETKKVIKK